MSHTFVLILMAFLNLISQGISRIWHAILTIYCIDLIAPDPVWHSTLSYSILRKFRLGEVSKDFCLFCGNSGNLLG